MVQTRTNYLSGKIFIYNIFIKKFFLNKLYNKSDEAIKILNIIFKL